MARVRTKGTYRMSYVPRMRMVRLRAVGKTEIGRSRNSAMRETMACTTPSMTSPLNVIHPQEIEARGGSNHSPMT
jgi:hypothetical protein